MFSSFQSVSLLILVCLASIYLSHSKRHIPETPGTTSAAYNHLIFGLVYKGTYSDVGTGAYEWVLKSATEQTYTGIHPGEGITWQVQDYLGGNSYLYTKSVLDTANSRYSGDGNVTFGESSAAYGFYFYIANAQLFDYSADTDKNADEMLSITFNITDGFGIYEGAYGWLTAGVTLSDTGEAYAITSFNLFYPGSEITTTTPAPFPASKKLELESED